MLQCEFQHIRTTRPSDATRRAGKRVRSLFGLWFCTGRKLPIAALRLDDAWLKDKEGINDIDKMGRLPIHVAANYDAVDAVKFLLSMSPEGAYTMVHRPPHNSGGGLPLHIACRNHGSIGVITAFLAENFASAKRTDENGDLPLHLREVMC